MLWCQLDSVLWLWFWVGEEESSSYNFFSHFYSSVSALHFHSLSVSAVSVSYSLSQVVVGSRGFAADRDTRQASSGAHVVAEAGQACWPLGSQAAYVDTSSHRSRRTSPWAYSQLAQVPVVMENSTEFSPKNKTRTIIQFINPTTGYLSKTKKISISKGQLHSHVYCNTIHDSQDIESTQMPISK